MQEGYIYKKENKSGGASWILRYYDVDKKHRTIKLTDVSATYPREQDVRRAGLADPYLNPSNMVQSSNHSAMRLSDFIEHVYFTTVKKKPATIYGYKHLFEKHLKTRLGDIRVANFIPGTGQKLMRQIAAEEPQLSHVSLTHIKHFLTGVFTFAIQESVYLAANPMRDVEVPEGNTDVEPTYAYDLVEITKILEALEGIEPARTVVATAAFSGLRKSELRGLRWADLRDGQLHVTRNVWETVIQERKLKTAASRGAVPVIPQLAKILEAHRNGFADDAFIFAGPKMQKPLDLKNLANRIIIPKLKESGIEWHGFHSFRRGLGTNLYHLGVPDKIIQAILRHSDLATTMKHYVKPISADVKAAMGKLSRVLQGMSKKGSKR